MAVLVVLIVIHVVVEVALFLEVARRIRTGLHVVRYVPGLGPGVVPLAEVLRATLLVRPILCCRLPRPKRLNVVPVGGLLASGVTAIRQSSPVVGKGRGCPVPWVN